MPNKADQQGKHSTNRRIIDKAKDNSTPEKKGQQQQQREHLHKGGSKRTKNCGSGGLACTTHGQ